MWPTFLTASQLLLARGTKCACGRGGLLGTCDDVALGAVGLQASGKLICLAVAHYLPPPLVFAGLAREDIVIDPALASGPLPCPLRVRRRPGVLHVDVHAGQHRLVDNGASVAVRMPQLLSPAMTGVEGPGLSRRKMT